MPLTMFVVIGMGLCVVVLSPYADPYMDAITVFGYDATTSTRICVCV